MSFKESFKKARLKSGLSQEKAGNAIHRTRNAIKGYEEGISSPNPDQLAILCRLFNTTPNDLLEFQYQQQNEEAKNEKIRWKNFQSRERWGTTNNAISESVCFYDGRRMAHNTGNCESN